MNLIKLIFCFLISTNLFAYTPSVESILRNGSNSPIESSTIVANIYLKEIVDNDKQNEIEKSQTPNVANEATPYKNFIKLVYFVKDNSNLLVQQNFKDTFSKSSLREVKLVNNYNKTLSENFPTGVFYGVLNILLTNNPELFLQTIKKINPTLSLNKDLENKELVSLIAQYKEYLSLIKQDADLKNSLENPLRPLEEEKQIQVKELIKSAYFTNQHEVKLVKLGQKLKWQITDKAFTAQIDNETRKIEQIKIINDDTEINFTFKDYILQNSKHTFPDKFSMEFNDRSFEIKLEKLYHFEETKEAYLKRVKKYNKSVSEANPEKVAIDKPIFSL